MIHLTKNISFIAIMLLSTSVLAHPGHELSQHAFVAGVLHPLTGLDHLAMVLGFGVVAARALQQQQWLMAFGLMCSLVVGFVIGAEGVLPSVWAEYGIVASLVVIAVALWTHSKTILPWAAMLLLSCHGMAHGTELAGAGHVALLMLGMLSTMLVLYGVGILLAQAIRRYVPHGEKLVAMLIALVAALNFA